MSGKGKCGFTLIELMVVIAIIGILTATSIPAYQTYRNLAMLLAAEMQIRKGLLDYGVIKDYSPATGMLADVVSEGMLSSIPNDPWTDRKTRITGAEEVSDWYYENDGTTLTYYALSHPHRRYELPSFGQPPLATPAVVPTPATPTTPAVPADEKVDKGKDEKKEDKKKDKKEKDEKDKKEDKEKDKKEDDKKEDKKKDKKK